jgi:hypothetical protein
MAHLRKITSSFKFWRAYADGASLVSLLKSSEYLVLLKHLPYFLPANCSIYDEGSEISSCSLIVAISVSIS